MIVLTPAEIRMAIAIGGMRREESIAQNLVNCTQKDGYVGETAWDMDINGAGAELAYCKFRNVYWGGCVNNFKEADVGNNIQIRSTKLENGGLIIRPNDDPTHYYVLVVGQLPKYDVVGWILGADGMDVINLRAPNGREAAYFVPQSKLHTFP